MSDSPIKATDPVHLFAEAVHSRSAQGVADVLEQYPELMARLDDELPGGHFGATPLIVAVQQENRELIDVLLAAGANINQRSHWWAGGFHVLEHDHGLGDFLIARGAVLEAKSAAQLGRYDDLVAIVTANPAAVNERRGDGQMPLHVAATVEIAKFLVEHGAELDAQDVDHESTPAQYLIRSHTDVARYLVQQGASVDILLATALGDIDRVQALLDADPSLVHVVVAPEFFPMKNPRAGGHIYTWTLGQGKSAALLAHEFGHQAIYHLLLDRMPLGTRLTAACEVGDEATVAPLLEAHPGLVATLPPRALQRLPIAALNDNLVGVRIMLAAGFPVGTIGPHGATALHWASWHGNVEMVRELLAHAPPLELRESTYQKTPLEWAIHGADNGWHRERGDYPGVMKLLRGAGAQG
jgi:ankyrin repeat protein